MRESYSDLGEFLDDVHQTISVKQMVMDMGIFTPSDFRGQKVCCCFHKEKTPSMQLGQAFFKCYGCGAGGDAVKFVQMYRNTGFLEAVREIAALYNVDISKMNIHFDSKLDDLKKEWNGYLSDAERAPECFKHYQRMFFPQEIGFDRKLGFVVMPFTSRSGAILGFTKRRVDELHHKDESGRWDKPKWMHSLLSDSLIAQCHNVFNLSNAAAPMRLERKAIVCEGPKDAIAWRRAGIEWVVGSCGTGNAANIWDSILPVDEVYLSMDGDKAGKKSAVANVVEISDRQPLSGIFVIEMPDGEDPYDVVIGDDGVGKLLNMLDNAISGIDFVCKHGEPFMVLKMYERVPEHEKMKVMKAICKNKGYGPTEAESWLSSIKPDEDQNDGKQELNEREELLKIVRGEPSTMNVDVNKAVRILKMKYNMKEV